MAAPVAIAGIWDFSVCNGSTTAPGTAAGTATNAGMVGNRYGCAATGTTTRDLEVSAWGAISATENVFGTAFVSNRGLDGFGVSSQAEGGPAAASPSDALDNDPSSLAPNLILLRFGGAVILDQVTLGWSTSDADLTIMAYTGPGTPSTFLEGKDLGTLTSGGAGGGWSLVQNVGDEAPDTAYAASGTRIDYSVNAGGVSSTYWLISAYSSGFGGGELDSLIDYTNLLGVAARDAPVPVPVPEPATSILVATAVLMIGRRRSGAGR
ncbi:MAG: PEP-CTERM sorting domain-containing protein [Alphaproteobacteria bacterium]|nr:PEP-CTERM sorting domain-containing protein [Alphaproteobacteria bacterium]